VIIFNYARIFCDLDNMTLILKLALDFMKMYLHVQMKFLRQSFKARTHKHRQANATELIPRHNRCSSDNLLLFLQYNYPRNDVK